MLTLHHLENSQSIRILWLLEELGVDYEFKMYDRDKLTKLAPADYKAISPLGTAPVITDGDVVLAETNAIMDYILDKAGPSPLRPEAGSTTRAEYLFWFHTAQGSLQPMLMDTFIFMMMKQRVPFFIKPIMKTVVGMVEKMIIKPRLKAIFGLMEENLSEHDWIAGDKLTAADMVMGYCVEIATARAGLTKGTYPHCHKYLARMRAHPSYQRALEIDGKFDPVGFIK